MASATDEAAPPVKRHLVMSFATAAAEANIRRFIASVRRFCSPQTTDVVLFVEPDELPFASFCFEQSVTLVPVRSFWKSATGKLPLKAGFRAAMQATRRLSSEVDRGVTQGWLHPIGSRHLFYEDFLRTNVGYDLVMLTDSRDVVFQGDPFTQLDAMPDARTALHAAEQEPAFRYGGDNVDTTWVRRVYGESTLKKLKDTQTLCAGTTFASRSIMLEYLAAMSAEILRNRTQPLDQAIHNKLLHLDWPQDRLRTHSNRDGFILTMFGMKGEHFDLREDAQVYVNDALPPVLHQWDHIKPVKAAVNAWYGTS